MRSVRQRRQVPYTPAKMFDLVGDVDAYPEFLHWCRGASVDVVSDAEVVATVEVGIGGVRRYFTTRNLLSRPDSITMELISGPFSEFSGRWRFRTSPGGSCVVELKLDFEVSSIPLEALFAALFEDAVETQVAAFVSRAYAIYGPGADD